MQNLQIQTSNYESINQGRLVSISGDGGKEANFRGERCYLLAPKKSFWQQWHDNIGVVPDDLNNDYYIRMYYKLILLHLDYQYIVNLLNHSTLLCYEEPDLFCHRHIVAAWLEIKADTEIPEIKTDLDKNVIQLERPQFIKPLVRELIQIKK